MGKQLFRNVLTFLAIFIVVNMLYSTFVGDKKETPVSGDPIQIKASKSEYGLDAQVQIIVTNNTDQPLVIPNECPGEPLTIMTFANNTWIQKESKPEIPCAETKDLIIAPKKNATIDYVNWNHSLFGELGRYKATFKTPNDKDGKDGKIIESPEWTVVEASIWRKFWMMLFYQPIYNTLIFLAAKLPGKNLGYAIILLTILIRLILLVPSQKALKSQKKMQELQPKLSEIKEKYKDDQQKQAKETMQLWKDNKVNPFSSCLPLIIQFPVLIALFYVVQTGLNPDNTYLLYNGFIDTKLTDIGQIFLGVLDLTKRNLYVLPLLVGLMQFAQMKMMLAKKPQGDKKQSEMEIANSAMTYMMPVMIAVFTASTPSGVGLYWATTTFFSIIQQYTVNRSKS